MVVVVKANDAMFCHALVHILSYNSDRLSLLLKKKKIFFLTVPTVGQKLLPESLPF